MKSPKMTKAARIDFVWTIGILLTALVLLHYGSESLIASGANSTTQSAFALTVAGGVVFAFFLRWRIKRRQLKRAAEGFGRVAMICQVTARGIYKRIDENRELLELLQQESPDLLNRCPWVEGWIDSQDRFLVDLAETVGTDNHMGRLSARFPRQWPGRNR